MIHNKTVPKGKYKVKCVGVRLDYLQVHMVIYIYIYIYVSWLYIPTLQVHMVICIVVIYSLGLVPTRAHGYVWWLCIASCMELQPVVYRYV